MTLPKAIRLGGRAWPINLLPQEQMPGLAGQCHLDQSVIDISQGQHPVDEVDSLVHEVFHAILYCQGRVNGGKTEETYVRALATGLTHALIDNPEFAQWLHDRVRNQ